MACPHVVRAKTPAEIPQEAIEWGLAATLADPSVFTCGIEQAETSWKILRLLTGIGCLCHEGEPENGR